MEKNLTIFCDLDGPILNNKHRHYTLYKNLLRGFGLNNSILTLNSYWTLKRDKVSDDFILRKGGIKDQETIEFYKDRRLALIETKSYLNLNKIVRGVKETLDILQRKGRIFLVTTRESRENLMWELQAKGLLPYFHQVLSSPARQSASDTKIELISHVQYNPETAFIIGDTEVEIIVGKKLNILTVAVLNGIRSAQSIKKFSPDFTIKTIKELSTVIAKCDRAHHTKN